MNWEWRNTQAASCLSQNTKLALSSDGIKKKKSFPKRLNIRRRHKNLLHGFTNVLGPVSKPGSTRGSGKAGPSSLGNGTHTSDRGNLSHTLSPYWEEGKAAPRPQAEFKKTPDCSGSYRPRECRQTSLMALRQVITRPR